MKTYTLQSTPPPTLGDLMPEEIKPKPKKKYLTPREKALLIEQARALKASGHNLNTIGETLGVHPTTVCKWLRARIIKSPNKNTCRKLKYFTQEEIDTTHKLRSEGVPATEIAKQLNRPLRSVYRLLDKTTATTKQIPKPLTLWQRFLKLLGA